MPTNRPFLSSFLAAFRAHSSLQNAAASKPPSQGGASSASHAFSTTSPTASSSAATSPRPITSTTSTSPTGPPTTSKPSPGTTAAAVQAATHFHATRHHHHPHHPATSPTYSRSPQSPTPFPPLGAAATSRGRSRRGSDSSSEGFRDVSAGAGGAEKWYIGGRTPAGEERFYKLGMVKRPQSVDRMSLDRLSL